MSNTISFVKCFEPISKKPYYYNCISHEAQWTVPKGVNDTNEEATLPTEDPTICNYVRIDCFRFYRSML